MIEKYTDEELQTIIKELRAVGYEVKQTSKQLLMKEEAVKIFGGDPFVTHEIGGSIFRIADFITGNYDMKNKNKSARKHIPGNIEEKYRTIVSGMLKVIQPYYGMLGFVDKNNLPMRHDIASEESENE